MAFVSFMVKSFIHLGNDAPICIQYRNVSYQMQNTYFNYPFLTHNKENQEFLCSANQILREINFSVFRKFKNCHFVQFQRNWILILRNCCNFLRNEIFQHYIQNFQNCQIGSFWCFKMISRKIWLGNFHTVYLFTLQDGGWNFGGHDSRADDARLSLGLLSRRLLPQISVHRWWPRLPILAGLGQPQNKDLQADRKQIFWNGCDYHDPHQ